MKLYILTPVESLCDNDDPWNPWYDKAFGFIVRAKTEEDARALADQNARDENRKYSHVWLDSKYVTCKELSKTGERKIIMADLRCA